MMGEWKKIALLMAHEMESTPRNSPMTSFEVLAAATFFRNLNATKVTPNRSSACQTLTKLWLEGLLIKRNIPNRNGMVAYSLTPEGFALAEAIVRETNANGQIMRDDTEPILVISDSNRRYRNQRSRISVRSITRNATFHSQTRFLTTDAILRTYQLKRKSKIASVSDNTTDDKITRGKPCQNRK